jgi:glucose/arabinose dehydrogenase
MKNTFFSISFALGLLACSGQQPADKSANKSSQVTDTLPQPYETRSVVNFCKVLGWSGGKTPVAPEGFKVQSFGTGFMNPRWIYQLPNGDILVAECKKEPKGPAKLIAGKSQSKVEGGNRIVILRDADHDGQPEIQQAFITDLHLPFGMLVLNDYFYVACTDAVWRYKYKSGDLAITSPAEKVSELPAEGRHWTKSLVASPDGKKIYVGVGSGSDVGENGMQSENRRACILQMDPDGSHEKVYASGLRNPVGMDWHPGTGMLWTAVNERDMLGDDLVPDYATSVKEDGFYGWPYSYFGQHIEPRIKEKDQRKDLVEKAIVPDVDLGSHTASLGFAFYTKNKFPSKYQNGAFIGQHGSWNRSNPSGYKVVFIPFNGSKPGKPEDFLTGFMADEKKNHVYGRPVGVLPLADGSLLVADDAGNMIWRVSNAK